MTFAGLQAYELVAALLDRGADPNRVFVRGLPESDLDDSERNTALCEALDSDDATTAELLLRNGADPNIPKHAGLTALMSAAYEGEVGVIELLLRHGADPLARSHLGETALLCAAQRASQGGKDMRPAMRLLREAARKAAVGMRAETLVLRRRKPMLDPDHDHGVSALRASLRMGEPDWAILCVRAPVERAAHALANAVQSPRWERDVGSRLVVDAPRLCFVFRLRGSEWCLAPLIVGEPVRGVAETAELAASVAKEADASVLELYSNGFVEHDGESAKPWAFDAEVESLSVPMSERAYARREAELFAQMDAALAARGVLVPPIGFDTDGYHVKLVLGGLRKGAVERVDVVVLEEFPE